MINFADDTEDYQPSEWISSELATAIAGIRKNQGMAISTEEERMKSYAMNEKKYWFHKHS